MEARASNALSATPGLAYRLKNLFVKKKVLLWLVMEMAKPEVAILATDYINNVLVLRAINTPAPAQATPEVPVPLATASMPNAHAQVVTVGMAAVALFLAPHLINTLVLVPAMPEAQALLAEVNIQSALVQTAMSGTAAAARNKFSTVPKESCITATARWLVLKQAV